MNRFDRAALAAALTLALTPWAATAQPGRVTVAAHVLVRDLDLATPAGRKAFQDRVTRAATHACGTAADLHASLDVLRCRDEMRRDADVRLASLAPQHPLELAAVRIR